MKRVGAWWDGLSTRRRVMFVVAALLVLPAGWIIVSELTRSSQLAPDDGDWKYVRVRRLLIYMEPSIDPDTQWVVFEPNGELVRQARVGADCSGQSVGIAQQ